jgi:hypothetical protein
MRCVLADRLREVDAARAEVRAARCTQRPMEQRLVQEELLVALERYASAIADFGAPLPYRLHAEIEMYRRLGKQG